MSKDIQVGQCWQFRRRHWLVEEICKDGDLPTYLDLSCVDDDAEGQSQLIIPSIETGGYDVENSLWESLGKNTPTDAKGYSAYLQSLQWNTATASDAKLFQAPFRAGIELSPYQLAPLAKALDLPRVNLLIADDVGLGKTIEAGLVLREMLLRRRVDFYVVSAPASMTLQWQEELNSKFGLSATIVDFDFLAKMRAERGFGYNPWNSGHAYILSHSLLADPTYTAGLQAVLGETRSRSMLILDEAHHAAPAHGQAFGEDSQMTKAVRDLAKRFEHRLFLTATPHNGHSNSFAALLEMLDPQRFTRGIEIKPEDHEDIMVRRLKSDLRDLTDTPFPERRVERIPLGHTEIEAPELRLAQMLAEFGDKHASALGRRQTGYAFVRLQQRLLSSVPAFATTLTKEIRKIDNSQAKAAAQAMLNLAQQQAYAPDARSQYLSTWIKEHLGAGESWNDRRLIIFTEFEDTLLWLRKQLLQDLSLNEDTLRIALYTGDTTTDDRERVKSKFNADPEKSDLRILICTDAAREGINLQHQCYDLFHFDLPWNPSRLEQRNGRIDRRLQPSPHVYCRYFVYQNREADRILDALVRKTERINKELGEVGTVVAETLESRLENKGLGLTGGSLANIATDLESEAYIEAERKVTELRLRPERKKRIQKLENELRMLTRRQEQSALKKGVAADALQNVFLNALNEFGAPIESKDRVEMFDATVLRLNPQAESFQSADWTTLFDSLRTEPRAKGEKDEEYRARVPLKKLSFTPVKDGDKTLNDIEHLHLEHRLVKRLLAQFEAQGFRSRLERSAVLNAPIDRARAVLLARLTLYAKGASRLHSEIISVTANVTQDGVTALKEDGRTSAQVLLDLQKSLETANRPKDDVVAPYLTRAAVDALTLKDPLLALATASEANVREDLLAQGEEQARSLETILKQQKARLEDRMKGRQGELNLQQPDEIAQFKRNQDGWNRRLEELEKEINEQPDIVRQRHVITARRLEPMGLVYLLPEASS